MPPAPDDDDVLVALGSTLARRVHRDRHRLHERRGVFAEPERRDLETRRRRDGDEPRQRAVALEAYGPVVGADTGMSLAALKHTPQEIPAPLATRSPSEKPSTPSPMPTTRPPNS